MAVVSADGDLLVLSVSAFNMMFSHRMMRSWGMGFLRMMAEHQARLVLIDVWYFADACQLR